MPPIRPASAHSTRLTVVVLLSAVLMAGCGSAGGAPPTGLATAPPSGGSPSVSSSVGGHDDYGYGGDDADPTATPAASATPALSATPEMSATPATSGSGSAAGETWLGIGSGPDGSYLTGADGMTLYIFTRDSANKSVCEGGCAADWPPVTVDGAAPAAPEGATGRISTFERSDGTTQVAYRRKPLYYYVGDSAPGDTAGQGLGDVWFIAEP